MAEDDKPDIEIVLSYYAGLEGRDFTLKQTAGKVKISCPFHNDERPSAVVNLETGRFHCFAGCEPSGDSYDVIQQQEGIGFNDAKQWAVDHLDFEGGEVLRRDKSKAYRPSWIRDDD